MSKLHFIKPLVDDEKHYIGGEEVVRWGYFFDSSHTQVFAYAITKRCKAYRLPACELVAECREPPRPEDRFARRASWSTRPWLQRSYTKLASLCRKDFEARSKTQEVTT